MIRLLLSSFLLFVVHLASFAQSCQFQVFPTATMACMGDTVCVAANGNVPGALVQQFGFNSATIPSGWDIPGGGSYGQSCDPSPTGTDYYWSTIAGTTMPMVTTNGMDVSTGGVIQFDLVFALQGGAAPCEGPDLWDEGVFLQYSIDNGSTWVDIAYFNPLGNFSTNPGGTASGPTAFTSWGTYCFPVPPGAQTAFTKFRWMQPTSSGANFDNWGLDEISISEYQAGTSIGWSNGASSVSSICVPVNSDTTITAYLLNSLGDTLAQDQTMISVVAPYSSSDSVMICQGDDYTFADGSTITNITTSTTYTSAFQNVNGCDSTITTTVVPFAGNTSVTQTDSICHGDDYTFADGSTISNITTITTYTSVFQNVNGCDSTITTTVVPLVVNVSTTQTDSTMTATNTGVGVTYEWLDCGNNFNAILGETGQMFAPAQTGSYAVVVTENGCSDTSSCFTINNFAQLDEVNWQSVSIYPNPTKGNFTIDLGVLTTDVNVRILDAVGSLVFDKQFKSMVKTDVELEGSAGLYFVELTSSQHRYVYRITKE